MKELTENYKFFSLLYAIAQTLNKVDINPDEKSVHIRKELCKAVIEDNHISYLTFEILISYIYIYTKMLIVAENKDGGKKRKYSKK